MTTVRIYVEHHGPLDGTSPLHPEATSSWNAQLGLIEVWSPPGAPLGRLDLAPLVSGGRGSEHWVEHLTVVSASGRHCPGSTVGLAGPTLRDVTTEHPPALPLVDLGASEAAASGVLTEGLSVPVPIDHPLVLDTRANGKTPGPHLIQITLGRTPQLLQRGVPSLRPGPPDKENASPLLSALVTLGGRTTVSTQVDAQPEGEGQGSSQQVDPQKQDPPEPSS